MSTPATYMIAGIELCDDDFNGTNNENSKSNSMINKNCKYIYDNIKPKSNQFVDKESIIINEDGEGILKKNVNFTIQDNKTKDMYNVVVKKDTEVTTGDVISSDTNKSIPAIVFSYNASTEITKIVGGKRKSRKRAKKVRRRRTHRRN